MAKEVKEEVKEETTATVENKYTLEDYYKEEVDFYEPIYDINHKDDVIIGVNGKVWRIKRGEHVKIPRYVKEVWDNSKKQDVSTYRLIEEYEKNRDAIIANI